MRRVVANDSNPIVVEYALQLYDKLGNFSMLKEKGE